MEHKQLRAEDVKTGDLVTILDPTERFDTFPHRIIMHSPDSIWTRENQSFDNSDELACFVADPSNPGSFTFVGSGSSASYRGWGFPSSIRNIRIESVDIRRGK